MKKTLLSIITMATLVGSMVAYAAPMEKEIPVSVTINGVMSLTDDKDVDISSLTLGYDAIDKKHTLIQPIKITSNTGNKVSFTVKEALTLTEEVDGSKVFKEAEVKLGNQKLTTGQAGVFQLTGTVFEKTLSITAEQPDDAESGEVYSGTLKLSIEAGV